MIKFKFNVTKEDVNKHIKNSLSDEQKEMLKDITFVPCNVHYNEDMNIEITAVGVLDIPKAEDESEEIIAENENK